MRGITLQEFQDWLKKNKHLTWYIGEGGGFFSLDKGGFPQIKYIDLCFDTRTMDIFSIKVRGLGGDGFVVYTSNEYKDEEGNLLDLLDRKLKEERDSFKPIEKKKVNARNKSKKKKA
jgi:hypothetical protein